MKKHFNLKDDEETEKPSTPIQDPNTTTIEETIDLS